MLRRRFGVRTAWLSAFVTMLVISSSLIVLGPGDRTRLDRDILAQSRGSNTSLVLTQSSCASLDGSTNCGLAGPGASCTVCTTATYTNVMGGANGGYNPGPPGLGGCGTRYSGTCALIGRALICPQTTKGAACNLPPGSPLVQP